MEFPVMGLVGNATLLFWVKVTVKGITSLVPPEVTPVATTVPVVVEAGPVMAPGVPGMAKGSLLMDVKLQFIVPV